MKEYDKLMLLKETLGADTLINELYNYFGEWQIGDAINSIDNDYDLDDECYEIMKEL